MLTDYLKVIPQYLVPTHLISWLFYKLTRSRFKPWKNWLINWFIKTYRVDMSLAEQADPKKFDNFNAFFTRALHENARPVDMNPDVFVCPVDGTISQIGNIESDRIFQAKGHDHSLERLLASKEIDGSRFIDGRFATIYLSPRDYHRIHMPVKGTLSKMVYVPGKLFSVNAATTRRIPALFARNERVLCEFETDIGTMLMVLVGALNVSRIDTVWAPNVGAGSHHLQHWDYTGDQAITLEKGAEMGRFNMGSTVILLMENNSINWLPDFSADNPVTMGKALARIQPLDR